MLRKTTLLALALFAHTALAQDPVAIDGDKYKVLLENDQVRVLAYTDRPGERELQHRHPAFVLVALAPFKRKLLLPDGRTIAREFKAGEVIYSPGETHSGENIGSTPTQVIIVELKQAPARGNGRQ